MAIKAPFQLFMLLGIFFLASVCVSSKSDHDQENPFFFNANRFQTLFENENGHIRLLQRFDMLALIEQSLCSLRSGSAY